MASDDLQRLPVLVEGERVDATGAVREIVNELVLVAFQLRGVLGHAVALQVGRGCAHDEVELAGMKRLLPALEALYATLSPAQRQTADAIFRQGPGG